MYDIDGLENSAKKNLSGHTSNWLNHMEDIIPDADELKAFSQKKTLEQSVVSATKPLGGKCFTKFTSFMRLLISQE